MYVTENIATKDSLAMQDVIPEIEKLRAKAVYKVWSLLVSELRILVNSGFPFKNWSINEFGLPARFSLEGPRFLFVIHGKKSS